MYILWVTELSNMVKIMFMFSIAFYSVFIATSDIIWIACPGCANSLNSNKLFAVLGIDVTMMDVIAVHLALITAVIWALSYLWIINDIIVYCLVLACVKLIRIS